ncbi:unnamed protein product [Prunus brigantina]
MATAMAPALVFAPPPSTLLVLVFWDIPWFEWLFSLWYRGGFGLHRDCESWMDVLVWMYFCALGKFVSRWQIGRSLCVVVLICAREVYLLFYIYIYILVQSLFPLRQWLCLLLFCILF